MDMEIVFGCIIIGARDGVDDVVVKVLLECVYVCVECFAGNAK